MPCALPQTHLDNQKVSEVGQTNWSKNCLQLNGSRRSSEVCKISPFNLRNIDQRWCPGFKPGFSVNYDLKKSPLPLHLCAVVTFPTLESDGQWRIFALPLQCFDHTNHLRSGNQGPQPAVTYPAKPFRGRSFSGSNFQHQFRNKTFAGKINKFSEVSSNSSYHCSITCNDSSAVTSKGFNAMFIDFSKENKSKRRDSQKRTKKKGKHKKKQFCDVGSTESEVYSQYTRASSASEICDNNDIDCCIVVSGATSPEVSPSDGLLNVIDFAESSNGAVTSSGSPNISTSDVDEVEITGSVVPTQVQKFPREHHINNSEIGSEDQELSWCQGAIERKHLLHMGSLEGLHEKDFSDMHNSLALDSVFVGSNSEDSTSAGHNVKPFNDIHEISQSELPGSCTKKDSYLQKSLCSTMETHEYMGESKHGLARSSLGGRMVASGKRGKKFKCIPGSPSTCRPGTMGSLHGRMIIENSHSVWQRVQKNPVEKCCTELKKTGPICLEFDDAPVLKRNPNAINLSITDGKRKPKSMVPRKFKRKVTPASKQENNSFSRKECHPNKVDCPSLGTMKTESVNNFQAGPSSTEPCDTVCEMDTHYDKGSTGKDPGHGISFLENGNNIKNLRNLDACVNENENNHSGADYLIDETREQDLSAVATDLNKMAKALDDVYRAHMASEAVQMATGCPIAEFERLLHFCSPVICHSYSSVGCQTCLLDQVPSALLCRHETPNIPLGYLWQWNSKSHSTQNNTRISSPGVSVTSDISSTSRNSTNCGPIPIFSALVPQPHTAEPSSQLQVDDVFRSESSPVSPEHMLPVKSVDISQSDCLELAFEQPQQRLALYEKIQDLVRDEASPQCKMYGDPVYLNSINIHDLHPQSWYSVAWYPIYKIPDGNFRAAFLTYHSLGLLVRRRSKFDYPSVDASIVSPVVGLQSYNAQGGARGPQPRHSTINDICENQGLSPSWILKERLRTLEETASLMARAVVTKGNKTSVNRHPDYEFFFSRQQ
ncbi:DNA-directed RNA polymerases I, II, and III subunit RPABC4 [Gossypium australe]|uniref:DNA-directed RNA polymerases I, II, and III subunit RPABC4 n=1 Tax=Gossypium australe TaxID=47621 RepID=A0A5B6X0M9_9ROSI|nr:DNA-directed RNA polymerases I, II, and III subunit RPABC4 [Gossypium australe]